LKIITPSVSSSSKLHVGQCPQIDLELSSTRWSKLQKDVFKSLQLQRKKDVDKYFALVDTNGSFKKLTLFLPELALLQSLRTKYLVA
jgi:hypothetical protein